MSSQELNSLLNTIKIETDWQPTQELMIAVFNTTAKGMLSENERWYRREESSSFPLIASPNVLTWFWNISENKEAYLGRLFEIYGYRSYGGPFPNGMNQAVKDEIQGIVFKAWDVLPDESESQMVQAFRIRISQIFPDKKINFTEKLLRASISADKTSFDFWSRSGREVSTDPAFYSMIWSKIERSKGYTDKRSSVIQSAGKCNTFPEEIINDLTSAGHNKNKGDVISVAIDHISKIKKSINRDSNLKPLLATDMSYWQSVLAKFISCDDHYLIQRMIPNMRKEDLIFIAPAAAAVGLAPLLEKYMNPEAYPDFHRDQYLYNY